MNIKLKQGSSVTIKNSNGDNIVTVNEDGTLVGAARFFEFDVGDDNYVLDHDSESLLLNIGDIVRLNGEETSAPSLQGSDVLGVVRSVDSDNITIEVFKDYITDDIRGGTVSLARIQDEGWICSGELKPLLLPLYKHEIVFNSSLSSSYPTRVTYLDKSAHNSLGTSDKIAIALWVSGPSQDTYALISMTYGGGPFQIRYIDITSGVSGEITLTNSNVTSHTVNPY